MYYDLELYKCHVIQKKGILLRGQYNNNSCILAGA